MGEKVGGLVTLGLEFHFELSLKPVFSVNKERELAIHCDQIQKAKHELSHVYRIFHNLSEIQYLVVLKERKTSYFQNLNLFILNLASWDLKEIFIFI